MASSVLKPGAVIDNTNLSELFDVANSGGMRRSLARRHLVLIADWTKRGVRNRWDGDVLHYVGQGQGDQWLDRQNRTLARSCATGERLYLFEVYRPGEYTYRGRAELAGEPYRQDQPDRDGRVRQALVFPLRLLPPDDTELVLEQPPPPPLQYLPPGAYAVVRASTGVSPETMQRVDALLDLVRALGVDVLDRRAVEQDRYARRLSRWHERVVDQMRRAVRARVREMKRRASGQNQRWSLAEDETFVDADADEDRLRQVLDVLGVPDEFEKMRRDAEEAVPLPAESGRAVDESAEADALAELERQIAMRNASRRSGR